MIKQKREALKHLVKVTATLNRLYQGLQAVLLMGQSASGITAAIIEKFREYSDRLNNLPTDKLKNTLTSTELRLQQNIKQVIVISQKSDEELKKQLLVKHDKDAPTSATNIEDYVDDFKKKAQTSIALRIALKTRNVLLKTFHLPVPAALIEKQLAILEVREAECRKRIRQEMNSLDSDIDRMLSDQNCPDEIKQKLILVKTNLQQNISHFLAGKNIDEIPMMYESIELAAPAQEVARFETETNPAAETTTPVESDTETVVGKKIRLRQRSIFSRIYTWLTSPANVKWKDISKYK